jgi:hypothetical protein
MAVEGTMDQRYDRPVVVGEGVDRIAVDEQEIQDGNDDGGGDGEGGVVPVRPPADLPAGAAVTRLTQGNTRVVGAAGVSASSITISQRPSLSRHQAQLSRRAMPDQRR